MNSRRGAAAAAMLMMVACSSSSPDPIATRCAPHREREIACADAETRHALKMVGDMCQKALNGKNPQVFGPTSVKRFEHELACAVANTDCAAYATCKAQLDGAAATP